jgi:pyruvate kinase
MAQTVGQTRIAANADMTKLASLEIEKPDSFNRKCKIICTMGPSCWDTETLVKMIDAGMNVARLNFSHGDHEMHGQVVKRIREACKLRPDKPVAILLDTKGPEIRTGFFAAGGKIELKQGQDLKLVTDYSFKGDKDCFAITYQQLPQSVKPGNTILMADGSLSLTVKEVGSDFVITTVMNNCSLGERKNCNLPGVKVDLPVLQEKDKDDLLNFGIPNGVDFVAASFVQSAEDVKLIRQTLGLRGRSIKIISKIENEEGLKNFDAIVEESDGIMVARGDLGMEIPSEKVFLAQKMMISRCNLAGKPVVTATQMLESMTGVPRPTRAEAGDVANAVLDGTDCVMLSGETAAGGYPLNAVTIMRRICEEAEAVCAYGSLYQSMRSRTLEKNGEMSSVESICSSAVKSTIDANCKLIIALTETGSTARCIAKYRPAVPILAISASETTVRQLLTVRGVIPTLTASFVGTDEVIKKALDKAKADGMVKAGDVVVAIHGQREECPGHSNLLKMVVVP